MPFALAADEGECSPDWRDEVVVNGDAVCCGLPPFNLEGMGNECCFTGVTSLRRALATTALLRRDIEGGWEGGIAPRVLVLLLANAGMRW